VTGGRGSVTSHDQGSGLTRAMVAERVARGEVNDAARRTSRSVTEIVRTNVLTRFNAIIGVLCAVILITGHLQDALFGLIIVANSGSGWSRKYARSVPWTGSASSARRPPGLCVIGTRRRSPRSRSYSVTGS
jgi:hypothetical protein